MELEIKKFSEINCVDNFFDSLKASYPEFDEWFNRKAKEGAEAYVFYGDDGKINDFLYLKIESGMVDDVDPVLSAKRRLKVGTFKLLSRGTRRGERFMKKIMDMAIAEDVDEVYVTIFPTEELKYLICMFERVGFIHIANKHHGELGDELVLVKNMRRTIGDIVKDYPFVRTRANNKYLLAIYPTYHTKLFPDSILTNESYDIVKDIKPTNGIFKIYICWMKDAAKLKEGDNVVVYRTKDNQGSAYYRSVATSICTVSKVLRHKDFKDINDFLKQMEYSVFSENDLCKWYKNNSDFIVIKMLYNVAFTKKIIRKTLVEEVGIPEDAYWGFCKLTDEQFTKIIELGGANERYFVD